MGIKKALPYWILNSGKLEQGTFPDFFTRDEFMSGSFLDKG